MRHVSFLTVAVLAVLVLPAARADFDELGEFEDDAGVPESASESQASGQPNQPIQSGEEAAEGGETEKKAPPPPPPPRYILPPPFEPLQPAMDFATKQPMLVVMMLYMIFKNFLMPAGAFPEHEGHKITNIKSLEQYKDIITKNKLVVIDFYATWCGPCKNCAVDYGKMSAAEPANGFKFCKVDVDNANKVASECGVKSMPTFCFFENGKLIKTESGFSKANMTKLMESKRGKKAK